MLFDLDEDTRLLQRTVREFAEREVAPLAPELDKTKRFPDELVEQMGELGWMGIPFPEEYGGAGGNRENDQNDADKETVFMHGCTSRLK